MTASASTARCIPLASPHFDRAPAKRWAPPPSTRSRFYERSTRWSDRDRSVDPPTIDRQPPVVPESIRDRELGGAGAAAAEMLRRLGYTGPVLMIGLEAPIDRPNVSKDYLAERRPRRVPLRNPGLLRASRHHTDHRRRGHRRRRRARTVALDDGGASDTGPSSSFATPIPARRDTRGDQAHVHYLRTLEDSRSIIAALEGTEQAIVIGDGFIGLEVAASLRQRDVPVTRRLRPSRCRWSRSSEKMGRFVQDLHEQHGVEFRLGHTVSEIREHEVVLDNGEIVSADLVVIGVGVIPNTGLAEAAGLRVEKGVVVDDRLRSSDPHIWAAGDVASYPDQNAGRVRIEHWVLAQRQGQAAARNILGHDTAFTDPPFFWSQHYDIPINVVGHAEEWDEEIVRGTHPTTT